jgi:RimJ/RimL family protein N-acetyltransferase
VGSVPYADVEIRGDGFLLRAWRSEDAEAAFRIWSRPEVCRWLRMEPLPDVAAQAAELGRMIERYAGYGRGLGGFALVPDEVGTPVGTILLKPLGESEMIEVGWHMNPDYWGQGLAPRGGIRILRYGFQDLGLAEVYAIVQPQNARSNAVARKVGLHDTGGTWDWRDVAHTLYRVERADWLERF